MTNTEIYKKRIASLMIMSLSPILAVAPFVIGIVGATLTPGCNGSNCPWGVLPWFSFLTTPVALVLFIVALIRFFILLGTRLSKSSDATPEERKQKSYYFAWMATAAGPLLMALLVLMTIFGGPVAICDQNDVCTETGQGAVVGTLSVVAPALLVPTWLYLFVVWLRNRVKR
jgi:hypothetical protein